MGYSRLVDSAAFAGKQLQVEIRIRYMLPVILLSVPSRAQFPFAGNVVLRFYARFGFFSTAAMWVPGAWREPLL